MCGTTMRRDSEMPRWIPRAYENSMLAAAEGSIEDDQS